MNQHSSDGSPVPTPGHAAKQGKKSLLFYGGIVTACLGLLITFVGTVVFSHVGYKSANPIADRLQLAGQFIMLLSLIVIMAGYRLTRHRQQLERIADPELRAHTQVDSYRKAGTWIISILLLAVPLALIFAMPGELFYSSVALCQLTLLSFIMVVIAYDRSGLQAFCIAILLPALLLSAASYGLFHMMSNPVHYPSYVTTTNPALVSIPARLEIGASWIALIPFGSEGWASNSGSTNEGYRNWQAAQGSDTGHGTDKNLQSAHHNCSQWALGSRVISNPTQGEVK